MTPARDYIAAMTAELARLAERDREPVLAHVLRMAELAACTPPKVAQPEPPR